MLACSTAALAAPGPVTLRPHASGLSSPVDIVHAADGSGRLFVVEQGGRIRIVRNGSVLPAPFLDLAGLVQAGGEQGLLGLAFDPAYAANGRFFVFYTRAPSVPAEGGNDLVVARYLRSASNVDLADSTTGTPIVTIRHPANTNHNGGKLAFGPDGFLYISVGDGGGADDPFNAGQNLADLRGKLLRIDVSAGSSYTIPASNPFASQAGARSEIFAYGLRNPWRFSFDRASADIFIGDVGQGAREEVDYIAASSSGQNFGWRVFEGTACHNPSTGCSLAGHVPPILEYGHNSAGGFSITGGFRYRGQQFRELYGHYVYGDYVSGRLWAAEQDSGGNWSTMVIGSLTNVSTFGEDEDGELYAANLSAGTIVRFAPPDADGDGMSDAFETQFFGSATAGDPAADGDGDGIPNLQEYQERTDPTAKDNDVFNNARLFAMQLYRDFLAREGDAGGIRYWTNRALWPPPPIMAPQIDRESVIMEFFGTGEFQDTVAPIARLYFACFLRIPDYGGLVYWSGQHRAGSSLDTISGLFSQSAEFTSRYGSLDNAQFVQSVYQNVLGRAPEPGAQAYWTNALNSGALDRGQMMLQFSESGEFRNLIANEVAVTLYFAAMLRRAPAPGGFNFWVGRLDGGGNSEFSLVEAIHGSAEYRGRFLP